MRIPGVVGTAVGLLRDGKAAVKIFLARPDVRGLPRVLDGVPVAAQVTGQFIAFSDPTTRQRPAPPGFSVGHPDITAGTIGARVADGSGHIYVLSNNHVLANSNDASIGDPALQPGPYDGGTPPADQIGTLFAFKQIDFSGGDNTIDAAIALSSTSDLGNATPTDDGYGTPSAAIFGDANNDGVFDDKTALLGLNVQKYGRTTKLTKGQITGINGTVTVCYEVFIIFCLKSATYVDQLTIAPQSVPGLAAGASTTLTFSWNTTASSIGNHTLTASHDFTDENAANNQASTTVTVNSPSTLIHVGNLDGTPLSNGNTWSATVEITVDDANHDPVNGATVTGRWRVNNLNASQCITGDLGGNGTCIVLVPSLKRGTRFVTFTVTNVT